MCSYFSFICMRYAWAQKPRRRGRHSLPKIRRMKGFESIERDLRVTAVSRVLGSTGSYPIEPLMLVSSA